MSEYFDLDEMKQVGPRVYQYLQTENISVKKVAKDLNIEISHYYRLLRGERSFTIENIIAHCLYLDLSIVYLLFGEKAILLNPEDNVIPGDVEILAEKLIVAIERLDAGERKRKAAKLARRLADLIEKI